MYVFPTFNSKTARKKSKQQTSKNVIFGKNVSNADNVQIKTCPL